MHESRQGGANLLSTSIPRLCTALGANMSQIASQPHATTPPVPDAAAGTLPRTGSVHPVLCTCPAQLPRCLDHAAEAARKTSLRKGVRGDEEAWSATSYADGSVGSTLADGRAVERSRTREMR
ncbi:hypothetical protein DPSP01_004881 [Paraphaeosphaeria sporulosa]